MHALPCPRVLLFVFLLFCPFLAAQELSPADESIPENVVITATPEAKDSEIEKRLAGVFKQVSGLEEVKVRVRAGVATLSGEVSSSEDSETAGALAKQTQGIVYVRNSLQDDVSVRGRLEPATERAQLMLRDLIRKLPLIGIALAVLIGFVFLGKILGGRQELFKRMGMRELSAALLARSLRLLLSLAGFLIALEILDATTIVGAVLGVAGVAGIALGFAFQNIIENYLAGVLLSMRNPFATGDTIEIEGFTGKVLRLTSRDTVLMTSDGNHVRLPNSMLMTSPLTNFTRNSLRRFEFAVGVSVELDLAAVRHLGIETLKKVNGILTDPPPAVIIEALGDSTVNMRFFAWINQTETDFLKCKSEAIRLVKDAFDENEVEMPEPIYRVLLHNQEAATGSKQTSSTTLPKVQNLAEATDTSADQTLNEQVEKAIREDGENNMLE